MVEGQLDVVETIRKIFEVLQSKRYAAERLKARREQTCKIVPLPLKNQKFHELKSFS